METLRSCQRLVPAKQTLLACALVEVKPVNFFAVTDEPPLQRLAGRCVERTREPDPGPYQVNRTPALNDWALLLALMAPP